jgi:hypothetical protein
MAVLYRPYVLNAPTSLPVEGHAPWPKKALGRARAAASNTNSLLEKVIELNAVQLLKPMMYQHPSALPFPLTPS